MKRLTVLCGVGVIVAGLGKAKGATPFEFQSNVLGVTTFQEATAKLNRPDANTWHSDPRCTSPRNGARSCLSMSSLATFYNFVDDKLASISFAFNHDLYLTGYVEGLTEKFGEPVRTKMTYQNGYGAKFDGDVWTWKNDIGQIVLEEFGDSRQAGTLYYSDLQLDAEYKSRTKSKPPL